MARRFNSNDYTFRPTSLGAAMAAAGMIAGSPSLVREAKLECNGRMIAARMAANG